MPQLWVVNSSPFITLSKVGHAGLLWQLSSGVVMLETVAQEIEAGLPADPSIFDPTREAMKSLNLVREPVPSIPEDIRKLNLDPGESAVLILARDSGYTAVLDDRKARNAAQHLGILVIGTIGIVLRAKSAGHLSSATDLLRKLRDVGLYVSDDLLHNALPAVGET